MISNLTKTNLFLCGALLFLSLVHCGLFNGNSTTTGAHFPTTSTYPPNSFQNPDACQFYQIQSAIINCHKANNFFSETGERKTLIAFACLQKAYKQVWGVPINPTLPAQEHSGGSLFRWSFVWGSIRKGNPPPTFPHPIEQKYYNLLNTFKHSIDANTLNTCLGGNYPFDGHIIIDTSLKLIDSGQLDQETFINCYRSQLDLYGSKNNCSAN